MQQPSLDLLKAGRLLQAALVLCNLDSYHCCTLHLSLPAWRSRCAACNTSYRCSVHPKTRDNDNEVLEHVISLSKLVNCALKEQNSFIIFL